MLTVGDCFPAFELTGVVSNDLPTAFQKFSHTSAAGRWQIFFFYPKDFTFVCPTEIKAFDDACAGLSQRNTVLYGVSTDSDHVHLAWRKSHSDLHNLSFPLLSDIRKDLSSDLGILVANEGVCLRATFIVDPEGVIRHVSVNDLNVGRNVQEIVRTLDALQSGGLCACEWQRGDKNLEIGA